MKLLKQALAVVGTMVVIALLVALVAPQSARAVVATLVQITPGATTHVGQYEGQLVALLCNGHQYCQEESPSGGWSASPYVVPTGYTLIVTDYTWQVLGLPPNFSLYNFLVGANGQGYGSTLSRATSDQAGTATRDLHFTAGLRIASGVTVYDLEATSSEAYATIHGYLVPN
jgi:hypothetical protein